MKLLTILGARPQFIKAAVVSRSIAEMQQFEEILVHTGQHYDFTMSEVFFEELGIPVPTYHLGVGGLSHGAMTGRQLEKIEKILLEEEPDWVLVYGDTNSTLAGTLAAIKLNIPVAHIEAGLRSFNRKMPEEHNRVLTDHAADLLFSPTPTATAHLIREGIPEKRIKQVGDVMYDAALLFGPLAAEKSKLLTKLSFSQGAFILATIHRAETTDNPKLLQRILRALQQSPLPVVLPLHPRTHKKVSPKVLDHPNLHVIEPVGYLDMIALEQAATLIATDSGGVQKEAYFHGKPCLTLRTETEWIELLDAGWNRLAPLNSVKSIVDSINQTLNTQGKPINVFGNGTSSQLILQSLLAEKNYKN
jgi:UDP-GlcNAc3NAcA epimerase